MNERTCVTCVHWRFDSGSPGYSSLTPGDDWESECAKKHWRIRREWETEEGYRQTLLTAQSCPDYELVQLKKRP